ncbi:MAG: hypothetical protein KVP17_000428 [Porospora cf. gigantea B]|uniref:uncharacterized protein n=1 Tax=Porospora cf. gigantea B TaxID=2853592 RepID=UPI0035719398|nr:MAG: hypothetical protein KVP17_000428 [Porospora cf. gigantea B]
MLRVTSQTSPNSAVLASVFYIDQVNAPDEQFNDQVPHNPTSYIAPASHENTPPEAILRSRSNKDLPPQSKVGQSGSVEDLSTGRPLVMASMRPMSRSMSNLHVKGTKAKKKGRAPIPPCKISFPEPPQPIPDWTFVKIVRRTQTLSPAVSLGTFGSSAVTNPNTVHSSPHSGRPSQRPTHPTRLASPPNETRGLFVPPSQGRIPLKACSTPTIPTSNLNTVHSSQHSGRPARHASPTRSFSQPNLSLDLRGPTSPSMSNASLGRPPRSAPPGLSGKEPSWLSIPKTPTSPKPPSSNLGAIAEETIHSSENRLRPTRRAPDPPKDLKALTRVASPTQSETDKFPSATGGHDQFRPNSICLNSLVPAMLAYASNSTDILKKVKQNVDLDYKEGKGRTYIAALQVGLRGVTELDVDPAPTKPETKSLWSKLTSWRHK